MRDPRDAKAMAATLRAALATAGARIPHSRALEIVAAQFGLKDWNTLSAATGPGPRFTETCPIMRSFDEGKAREFSSAISASRWTGSIASPPACRFISRSVARGWSCMCRNTTAMRRRAPPPSFG